MAALRAIDTPIPIEDSEIRRFLCERYWLPSTDFPLCGDIFHALGLSGDDCHEFMNDFAEMFKVDLSDYVWPKYHLGEAEAMDVRAALRPLMRMAGLKTQPLNRDLVPISIDHLQLIAQAGRWSDPADHEATDGHGSLGRSFTRFSARLRAGGIPRIRNR